MNLLSALGRYHLWLCSSLCSTIPICGSGSAAFYTWSRWIDTIFREDLHRVDTIGWSMPTASLNLAMELPLRHGFRATKHNQCGRSMACSFNATVGCHHPNIWKFISAIKREQGLIEVRQTKYLGVDTRPRRKSKMKKEPWNILLWVIKTVQNWNFWE